MAEQLEFFPIPNPCKGVCQNNQKGFCIGCFRSRDERFYWQKYTDGQKRSVLELCRKREQRSKYRTKESITEENQQSSLF